MTMIRAYLEEFFMHKYMHKKNGLVHKQMRKEMDQSIS